MKTILRRIVPLLLVCAMMFLMTSCSGGTSSTGILALDGGQTAFFDYQGIADMTLLECVVRDGTALLRLRGTFTDGRETTEGTTSGNESSITTFKLSDGKNVYSTGTELEETLGQSAIYIDLEFDVSGGKLKSGKNYTLTYVDAETEEETDLVTFSLKEVSGLSELSSVKSSQTVDGITVYAGAITLDNGMTIVDLYYDGDSEYEFSSFGVGGWNSSSHWLLRGEENCLSLDADGETLYSIEPTNTITSADCPMTTFSFQTDSAENLTFSLPYIVVRKSANVSVEKPTYELDETIELDGGTLALDVHENDSGSPGIYATLTRSGDGNPALSGVEFTVNGVEVTLTFPDSNIEQGSGRSIAMSSILDDPETLSINITGELYTYVTNMELDVSK
jgi:hypothetical protein